MRVWLQKFIKNINFVGKCLKLLELQVQLINYPQNQYFYLISEIFLSE